MNPAPFIAISLILMIIVGVLALLLGGKDSESSNWDDPEAKKKRMHFFKRF
jgi:hypothetical protein